MVSLAGREKPTTVAQCVRKKKDVSSVRVLPPQLSSDAGGYGYSNAQFAPPIDAIEIV